MSTNGDNIYSVLKTVLPVMVIILAVVLLLTKFSGGEEIKIKKIGVDGVELDYIKTTPQDTLEEINEKKIEELTNPSTSYNSDHEPDAKLKDIRTQKKLFSIRVVDELTLDPIQDVLLTISDIGFMKKTNSQGEVYFFDEDLTDVKSYESFSSSFSKKGYLEKRIVLGMSQSQTIKIKIKKIND